MNHSVRKKNHLRVLALISFFIVLTVACVKKTDVLASNYSNNQPINQVNREVSINKLEATTDQLQKLLAEANWKAVEEARRMGKAALPIIRPFVKDKNEMIRQIAVGCAGAVGDPQGADILAAGLKDDSLGVQLGAARELAEKSYPPATETVLEVLNKKPEEVLIELLIKAAGNLPGAKTIATLRPFLAGDEVIATQTIYALAKLGDAAGRKALSARLSAKLPRTRYEALENLCYVNDATFTAIAKKLLSDKAKALPIGLPGDPLTRRVTDQAVDSLVCLLKLHPPFETSQSKVYTDSEIITIKNLIK